MKTPPLSAEALAELREEVCLKSKLALQLRKETESATGSRTGVRISDWEGHSPSKIIRAALAQDNRSASSTRVRDIETDPIATETEDEKMDAVLVIQATVRMMMARASMKSRSSTL